MELKSITIRNYKSLQSIHLTDLPRFLVLVGANGSGKSTLFDVFSFLQDALSGNVRQALDMRGGFAEVITRGHEQETIMIEIRANVNIAGETRLLMYFLEIAVDQGRPVVLNESISPIGGRHTPAHFLKFHKGYGYAVENEEDLDNLNKLPEPEDQRLDSPDILAIKGLGQFQRFRAASAFRQFFENFHVSDFHVLAAKGRREASGAADHLSETGENLPRVARYIYENHRPQFDRILQRMQERVPGINGVEPELTPDGYLILRFRDGSLKTTFIDRYVSDGTIRMFAYLILLYDPKPHPLLCVEEPENQLYPTLMSELAEEFRDYGRRGGQVMVSTHSPDLLNAVRLEEVFWLVKRDGLSTIVRAQDDPQVRHYMDEGDQMGYLWKQGFFAGADPR